MNAGVVHWYRSCLTLNILCWVINVSFFAADVAFLRYAEFAPITVAGYCFNSLYPFPRFFLLNFCIWTYKTGSPWVYGWDPGRGHVYGHRSWPRTEHSNGCCCWICCHCLLWRPFLDWLPHLVLKIFKLVWCSKIISGRKNVRRPFLKMLFCISSPSITFNQLIFKWHFICLFFKRFIKKKSKYNDVTKITLRFFPRYQIYFINLVSQALSVVNVIGKGN